MDRAFGHYSTLAEPQQRSPSMEELLPLADDPLPSPSTSLEAILTARAAHMTHSAPQTPAQPCATLRVPPATVAGVYVSAAPSSAALTPSVHLTVAAPGPTTPGPHSAPADAGGAQTGQAGGDLAQFGAASGYSPHVSALRSPGRPPLAHTTPGDGLLPPPGGVPELGGLPPTPTPAPSTPGGLHPHDVPVTPEEMLGVVPLGPLPGLELTATATSAPAGSRTPSRSRPPRSRAPGVMDLISKRPLQPAGSDILFRLSAPLEAELKREFDARRRSKRGRSASAAGRQRALLRQVEEEVEAHGKRVGDEVGAQRRDVQAEYDARLNPAERKKVSSRRTAETSRVRKQAEQAAKDQLLHDVLFKW